MNHIYKTVRSSLGLVVVSENAKGHRTISGHSATQQPTVPFLKEKLLILALTCAFSLPAYALNGLPSGGAFTIGGGTISRSGTTETINVKSTGTVSSVLADWSSFGTSSNYDAVINWSGGFDVSQGNTVDFTSTGSQVNVINVDTSGTVSNIAGNIESGSGIASVLLINPNGMTIDGNSAAVPTDFMGISGALNQSNGTINLSSAPINVIGIPLINKSVLQSGIPQVTVTAGNGINMLPWLPNMRGNVGVDMLVKSANGAILNMPDDSEWKSSPVDFPYGNTSNIGSGTDTINTGNNDYLWIQSGPSLDVNVGNYNTITLITGGYANLSMINDTGSASVVNDTSSSPSNIVMSNSTGYTVVLNGNSTVNLSGDNTNTAVTLQGVGSVANISGDANIGALSSGQLYFGTGSSLAVNKLTVTGSDGTSNLLANGSSNPNINLIANASGAGNMYIPVYIPYGTKVPLVDYNFSNWTISSNADTKGALGTIAINSGYSPQNVSVENITVNPDTGSNGIGYINIYGYGQFNNTSGINAQDFQLNINTATSTISGYNTLNSANISAGGYNVGYGAIYPSTVNIAAGSTLKTTANTTVSGSNVTIGSGSLIDSANINIASGAGGYITIEKNAVLQAGQGSVANNFAPQYIAPTTYHATLTYGTGSSVSASQYLYNGQKPFGTPSLNVKGTITSTGSGSITLSGSNFLSYGAENATGTSFTSGSTASGSGTSTTSGSGKQLQHNPPVVLPVKVSKPVVSHVIQPTVSNPVVLYTSTPSVSSPQYLPTNNIKPIVGSGSAKAIPIAHIKSNTDITPSSANAAECTVGKSGRLVCVTITSK